LLANALTALQAERRMIASQLKSLAVIGAVLASFVHAIAADGKLLWQIGKPDKSYAEFALARNYAAFQEKFGKQPVVFQVGQSDPSRDWPFIQPGPVDAWAGNREHPFTVRFRLDAVPKGVFTLRLGIVDAQSAVPPMLSVSVGKRSGQFQLKPGVGDGSLSEPKAGKPQQFELSLPASLFQEGENELVLTAVQGSWALYDSLEMFNNPGVDTANPTIERVTVEPTPLLVREKEMVRRVLKVKTMPSAPAADLVMRVEAEGETRETIFAGLGGPDGYEEQVSVPAANSVSEVTVTVQAGTSRRVEKVKVDPAIRWKIFVAASAHTDIGYTDIQPKCVERHNENTDIALDLLEKYPDFKWNLEVAWQAENYLAARQGRRVEQFLRFAREGRLGVQALYCNILTGLCSHEAGCLLTRCAHDLKAWHDVPFRSAMISDVPTQEASLPMLLAAAGIRYFSSGINNDRAYPFTRMQAQSPCWWEGPDGSRVLMNYATSYAQASGWGLDTSVEAAASRILTHLKQYESRTNYPFDAVFLHGAFGDNSLLSTRLPEVVRAWNNLYESPKLILSENAEFFEYIEKNYGEKLPVFRGSAGCYWEDGAGSSAFETALCRNAQESLATAEKLFALSAQVQRQTSYPSEEFETAWRNSLLYDEHTWGAHCSISQPDSEFSQAQWKIKAQFAIDTDRQAAFLLEKGAAMFAKLVKTEGPSLVVINSASWPRTDFVRVSLPKGMRVEGSEAASCDAPEGLLVLVKDVPACGYKVLKLKASIEVSPSTAMQGSTIESRYYRVTFDPVNGAITSLVDKQLQRELVDSKAPYALNQYLYVSGGEGSRIVMNPNGPEPELTISKPTSAKLQCFRLGELGERMVVESSGAMAPRLVSEITVWNDLRRVDFVNRFTKTKTYDKEAVYFAFPFAAENPVFRYQCPAGIVNANRDMLPGACLEWFSVQQCVEIDAGSAAITWATPDAPLVCFQDINRGKWLRDLPMKTGHLYSYAMNNYWHTNYKPGQGGDHRFRFSLTSRDKADNTESTHFGWTASNPLVAVSTDENTSGALPAPSASLIEIANPNVLLIAAKKADRGEGLVLRLWEVNGRSTTAKIRLNHFSAVKATACNLSEDPQEDLPVEDGSIPVPIRGFGLATIRLDR
jgi:hypothetical protein